MLKSASGYSQTWLKILDTASRRIPGGVHLARQAEHTPESPPASFSPDPHHLPIPCLAPPSTWLPHFLPTFSALGIQPTSNSFHLLLKAALILDRDAAAARVQHILAAMEDHGHRPCAYTDALILRYTRQLKRNAPDGKVVNMNRNLETVLDVEPSESRKLKRPERAALRTARGDASAAGDEPDATALGAVPDDTALHRIRCMAVKSGRDNHPRIRLKPDATTYLNLVTGIALEQNDLDTGALLLREMISVGLMIKSRILRLLIRASLRKAKDETIDEAKNNGVELAVGFLAVMCDARTTPKEALVQISPLDFRRTQDGVLGPRVYEGHGGRVLTGGQPSFLVFREFLEGAQGVRRLTGRDCGAIVLRLMMENGAEVDEGARRLAHMLDNPCLNLSPSLI
ncbi:hypothetical protein DFP72DRAFT_1165562 [Ephemerocybe angulata]|uniref:Pentatricopeptide repeat protein n=1 Tax=Ephemerocybe angulata TaxID=980116 RepID=A0A8H6IAT1_9AGAR|nr:hypothetical protein DFP72DRAFT_1165562 [Tulosesus angulatus]